MLNAGKCCDRGRRRAPNCGIRGRRRFTGQRYGTRNGCGHARLAANGLVPWRHPRIAGLDRRFFALRRSPTWIDRHRWRGATTERPREAVSPRQPRVVSSTITLTVSAGGWRGARLSACAGMKASCYSHAVHSHSLISAIFESLAGRRRPLLVVHAEFTIIA